MVAADFSWFALFTAGLATLAQAIPQTLPGGSDPSGNSIIKPGLAEIVPVGKPYAITWEPTTKGPVSIYLLHGPPTNLLLVETIASGIANTGTFEWTPPASLAPESTHYGIELVDEVTKAYQYTSQFGISNPSYSGSSSSASVSSYTSTRSVYLASSSSSSSSSSSVSSSSSSAKPSSYHVASTGYPAGNSTIVRPTGTITKPHSLKTTIKTKATSEHKATSTEIIVTSAPASTATAATSATQSAPVSTGAAAMYSAAGGVVALAAAAVFAL